MRRWFATKFRENKVLTAAVVCLLSLAAMTLALTLGRPQIPGEFLPPPFDEHALTGLPEVPENLGWTELDAKAFRVSVCGVVTAADGGANIWLTNPEGNEVWLKLRLLDQKGTILGETGLIRPGQFVQKIALREIPGAGTPVTLKIMAYEPETYHSAGSVSLNTNIYDNS